VLLDTTLLMVLRRDLSPFSAAFESLAEYPLRKNKNIQYDTSLSLLVVERELTVTTDNNCEL
jgi:hypothetical protein